MASVNDTKHRCRPDRVVFIVRWGKTIESAARDSLPGRCARPESSQRGAVLSNIDLKKHAQYRDGDIGQYYTCSRRYYAKLKRGLSLATSR